MISKKSSVKVFSTTSTGQFSKKIAEKCYKKSDIACARYDSKIAQQTFDTTILFAFCNLKNLQNT